MSSSKKGCNTTQSRTVALKNVALSPAVLTTMMLLSGCASISNEEHGFYGEQSRRLKAEPAALAVTACVERSEIGTTDFVLRKASLSAVQAIESSTESFFESSGLPIASKVAVICGATGDPTGDSRGGVRPAADNGSDKPVDTLFPLPISDSDPIDPTLMSAYLALFTKANVGVPSDAAQTMSHAFNSPLVSLIKSASETPEQKSKESGTTAIVEQPLGLDDASLQLLRRQLKAAKVWVINGDAVDVSMGSTIGMATVTAVLTGGHAATGSGDGHGYHVALVDLDANKILWLKEAHRMPGGVSHIADFYNENWAASTFLLFRPAAESSGGSPAIASQPVGAPVTPPVNAAVAPADSQ